MAAPAYHLTSNGPRVNTLVIDMAAIPSRKVNMDLIAKFVHDNLKVQYSEVRTLQHNTGKALVFVEVATEELAINATEINGGVHVLAVDKVNYKVNVYMEDGATTVRVHDVSPQTENTMIEKVLERYGQILWLKEETWMEPAVLKGIKNGIRAVRIKLHTAVPSYINIGGEVSLVTYKHQQQTCRHCHKPVHWGRKCIEASFMELQVQGGNISERLIASGVNYAGALKTGGSREAGTGGSRQEEQRTTMTSKKKTKSDEEVSVNFTNLNDLLRKQSVSTQNTVGNVGKVSDRNTRKASLNTYTTTRQQKSRSRSNVRNTRTRDSEEGSTNKADAKIGSADSNDLVRSMLQSNAYRELISDDDDFDGENARENNDWSARREKRNELVSEMGDFAKT